MAIAITPFRGFCGFLPPSDIRRFLDAVPELYGLVPPETLDAFRSAASMSSPPSTQLTESLKQSLRDLFGAVIRSSEDAVKEAVSSVVSRYRQDRLSQIEESVKRTFLELNSQFPNDVGVLAVYFLNIVVLNPGEAVFLKANEPHAYISGGELYKYLWRLGCSVALCRHNRDHGYFWCGCHSPGVLTVRY